MFISQRILCHNNSVRAVHRQGIRSRKQYENVLLQKKASCSGDPAIRTHASVDASDGEVDSLAAISNCICETFPGRLTDTEQVSCQSGVCRHFVPQATKLPSPAARKAPAQSRVLRHAPTRPSPIHHPHLLRQYERYYEETSDALLGYLTTLTRSPSPQGTQDLAYCWEKEVGWKARLRTKTPMRLRRPRTT